MAKEDLDLLNRFLTRAEREKQFRPYRGLLRSAQAFTLDDDTVSVLDEMASGPRRHRMVPIYRELARLPFDTVWIEFDYWKLDKLRQERRSTRQLADSQREIEGVPERMAFLCERLVSHDGGFRITTVGWMSPSVGEPPAACLFPVCHNVTTGPDRIIFAGNRHNHPGVNELISELNRGPLPAMAWSMDAEVDLHAWLRSPLQGTNGVEPEGLFEDEIFTKYGGLGRTSDDSAIERMRHMMSAFTAEQRGDLRFVVAALALLNHTPVIYKPHKPRGRMLASGTTRPFIESRIVTINVPQTRKRLKLIDDALRAAHHYQRRKRHAVRGHWRVAEKSHGDRWAPFFDPFTERTRWRIWIADHERGDASLGWVDHTYGVRARPGAAAALKVDKGLDALSSSGVSEGHENPSPPQDEPDGQGRQDPALPEPGREER